MGHSLLKVVGISFMLFLGLSLLILVTSSFYYNHTTKYGVLIGGPATTTSDQRPFRSILSKEDYQKWAKIIGKEIVPGVFDDCNQLHSHVKKDNLLPDGFRQNHNKFFDYIKNASASKERKEGTSLAYLEEARVYWNIATNIHINQIRTVCETGFNAGDSAFLWLSSNPDIQLYSFDIGHHKYAKVAAARIEELFKDRFHITWGDSTKTLPEFVKANSDKVKCDLMVIDGGHFYAAALSDFNNFAKLSYTGSIVILDNYPDERFKWDLGKVWESKRLTGELIEVFKCSYIPVKVQGFSVGILQKTNQTG